VSTIAVNLPPLSEVDWQLVADANVVLVGAGAVGRPLLRGLAQLGLRRAVIVDPKRYRERSIHSQCRPEEVGRLKAEVVAEELTALGVGLSPCRGTSSTCRRATSRTHW
jgi:tRNA A37 threonylcarbamoyladenosine dehydratase